MSTLGTDKSAGGIYAQFFNADGTKKGGEFLINSTTLGRQSDAQVVELNDGRVVVAWFDVGGGNVIRARHFNADGTPLGSDFKVNITPTLGAAEFSITALSNGGYAVAYTTEDRDVRVRGFTAALNAKSEVVVAEDDADFYRDPEIVAHAGGYTVIYGQSTVNDMWLHKRTFSNDGTTPINTADFISPQTNTKYHSADTAILTNGLTAVTWTEDYNSGARHLTAIKVQLLKSDGSEHGNEVIVVSHAADFLHKPVITHLADGGFTVAYYRDVPGEPDSSNLMDIYLATFDGNGNRVGQDLLVERMHATNHVKSLTTLADGRVVVSWASDQGETNPLGQELHARIIDPRQKAVSMTGTGRDDQYIGTRFDDTLDGGAGTDILTGAEGNDIYYVDNIRDQVKESVGQGIDTVIASSNYRLDLAADVEVLKLAFVSSRLTYTLEGSNSANAINGHAGANTLMGHRGNDKLYGGAGKDVLSGGVGRDVFVFDTKPNKNTNVDQVTDFKGRDDAFHLDNAVFTKLGSGSAARPKKISADMFAKGRKAQDAEDRIVYDKKSGALYYDQDGTGSKAQVKIATVTNKAKLDYDDFFVL
ncbi:calcium-binding protein [Microvirga sp. CF3062]|uniref:calcium-binding protein n=1 Tax=Microvirga sp. CF3062 TaxID=3110182 RepID=UPI002E7653FB|nr:calcium-binding protein [Microvirga sp. CF3062]MEE1655225.1 calcium-binding protein [Microvirga sp. CF3062]